MSIGSQDITDVIKSRLKDFKAELLSVGIEDIADLKADLRNALDAIAD